ncbi:hypothetical protein KIN20_019074 [Parelaphostrongylus tenuis]|uniref:Uncharacterized protein n=1 Tax=Parelaphostrongylus tenuis TaxID=148309 RepID=A0AAD5QSK6_PARTN|nr:hypothetical protein KIN20_019074 [Parelaphostrongylus tenuis]
MDSGRSPSVKCAREASPSTASLCLLPWFYSEDPTVSARVPGIAVSKDEARRFVSRLVMQTVLDVLETQGRNAFLPDTVISAILGQLTVNITYEPLLCKNVILDPAVDMEWGGNMRCVPTPQQVTITPIAANYTSISGALTTTNIIMANWSRTMWQSVINRAVRVLASGPLGMHFFSASGTVGGKLKLKCDMFKT